MLAIAQAEAQGDEPDQKRVATRRLRDPVPGKPAPKRKSQPKAPRRKKAPR
jgi:hypothetical protein